MNIQVINDFFSQLANYFRGFKNIKLSNIFNDWNIFEILWLVISVTSLGIISILTTNDYLVITTIAIVTGMLNILLVAKGKILNYFLHLLITLLMHMFAIIKVFMGNFYSLPFSFFLCSFMVYTLGLNHKILARIIISLQRVYQ